MILSDFHCILFFTLHLLFRFVNPFCISLKLDLHTPYSFPKCCCIFSNQWFCPLLFTFKISEKSYLLGPKIPVFLSYHFTVADFGFILCFSSSITNINPFLPSLYFIWSCPFSFFLKAMLLFCLIPSLT